MAQMGLFVPEIRAHKQTSCIEISNPILITIFFYLTFMTISSTKEGISLQQIKKEELFFKKEERNSTEI